MSFPFVPATAWLLVGAVQVPNLPHCTVLGEYRSSALCETAMLGFKRLDPTPRFLICIPFSTLDAAPECAENPLRSDTYGLSSLVHEQSPRHCASRRGFLFWRITE